MGAEESIELYRKGEPWFEIAAKEGLILEEIEEVERLFKENIDDIVG